MPITIKEIIASDTISQLVDKTNFNFDQLLLNGGGPEGPAGPIGPTGPAGGRGPKGTTWYEDTSVSAPGNNPNTVPPTATPLEGDYYLQFNGAVWEYTGLTWSLTTIDLQGPQGPPGTSGSFGLFFGSPSIGLETAIYPGPVGLGNGATGNNEGVPSIMIGGAVTTTPQLSGIPLTNAYVIPNAVAEGLISTRASMMIHQKDTAATSIVFHGGGAVPGEKFDQTDIGNLSNIGIGTDDKLILGVPKIATSPGSQNDLIGFEVNAPTRSHFYRAGKSIEFQTGFRATQDFAGENSNFIISVEAGSNPAGNQFLLRTAGTANSTIVESGGGFVTPTSQNNQIGDFQVQAGLINMVTSAGAGNNIQLFSGNEILIDTTQGTAPTGQIAIRSLTGGVNVQANGGPIVIEQSATGANTNNVLIENASSIGAGTVNAGDVMIKANHNIQMVRQDAANLTQQLAAPIINLDYADTRPHTRFVGQQTWAPLGETAYVEPANTTVQRLFDADSPLVTNANQVLTQYGKNDTTLSTDAIYTKWINASTATGNGAQTINVGRNRPSGTCDIQINQQQFGAVAPLSDPLESWYLNEKNAMLSVPLVFNRDSRKGKNESGYDGTNPGTHNSIYCWDTFNVGSPSATFIASLERPFIEVNIGRGIEDGSDGTNGSITNTGYEYDIFMPWEVGGVSPLPGSQFVVDVRNSSTYYSFQIPGNPTTFYMDHWGTVCFKVPVMRAKKASSSTWQDWVYKEYYVTAPQASNTSAWVARLSGSLVWNGAVRSNYVHADTGSIPSGYAIMDVQFGYTTGGLPDTVEVYNLWGPYL